MVVNGEESSVIAGVEVEAFTDEVSGKYDEEVEDKRREIYEEDG